MWFHRANPEPPCTPPGLCAAAPGSPQAGSVAGGKPLTPSGRATILPISYML